MICICKVQFMVVCSDDDIYMPNKSGQTFQNLMSDNGLLHPHPNIHSARKTKHQIYQSCYKCLLQSKVMAPPCISYACGVKVQDQDQEITKTKKAFNHITNRALTNSHTDRADFIPSTIDEGGN